MKLLVLAAGYATRLRPLTDHTAKPLLPVRGRPMIDHVIERFFDDTTSPQKRGGIDEIYVVTNHRFAAQFEDWANQRGGRCAGRPIRVFDDLTTSNDDRLGAIGDINFVMNNAGVDDDLIVVAGDNLFTKPLAGFVEAAARVPVLVGTYDVGDLELIKKYSTVTLDADGRITAFEEKPQQPTGTLTAIALYSYSRDTLPLIRRYIADGNNPDQPGRLVAWLHTRVPCYSYRIDGDWLDIGSPESYAQAQELAAFSQAAS